MTTKTKHIISIVTVGLFFALAMASSPSKRSMSVERHQIPPEFAGYKGTLLIISQSKSWNRYTEKYFSAHYSGKFKIVKEMELNKYPFSEEYRYILRPSNNTQTEVGSGHTYRSSQKLCITDRVDNDQYCTKSASHFSALLKKYAKALDEERTNK